MEENMKRFKIKSIIALILAVSMLFTGIPCIGIKAYADAYTADSIGQEITLPDREFKRLCRHRQGQF